MIVPTGPAAPPHAPLMTNTPKIVVSSTLDNADWGPTTVISGDVSAALARLKEQPGRDITVGGERHPRAVPAARAPAR
jgi:dihydrofolate reductase